MKVEIFQPWSQFVMKTKLPSKVLKQMLEITDNIYIGSRLHSNPGQKNANISSGIIPGARRQINLGINYTF